MSNLSKILLVSSALLLSACGNDANNTRVIKGQGACNLEARKNRPATDLAPFELDEEDAAPADLDRLLSEGTLETKSVRVTYLGPTNQPGLENSILVLTGGEQDPESNIYRLGKVCSKGFDPQLGVSEPIYFNFFLPSKEEKFTFGSGVIEYGPHLEEYMRLSLTDDELETFNSEEELTQVDFLNQISIENFKAYILKKKKKGDKEKTIPDSFNDEAAANTYTIAYEDKENGLRYHLVVLWTPDSQEEGEADQAAEPVIRTTAE